MLQNMSGIVKRYAVTLYAAAFLFTASTSLIGPMLSAIMADFGMHLNEGGNISLFQYIGGVAAIVAVSPIIDRVKKPWFAVVCYSGMAACLVVMGIAPSYLLFCVFYLVFGGFNCVQDTLNNALISDIFQENRGMALNLLHGICGLGGTFMPILSGVLLDLGVRWSNMYLLTAAAVFLIAFCLILTYRKVDQTAGRTDMWQKEAAQFHLSVFVKDRRVWCTLLGIFAFGIFQSGMLVWSAKYTEAVYQPTQYILCTLAVSAVWLGTAISRILQGTVPALIRISPRKNIVAGSLLAGAVLIAAMLCRSYPVFLLLILAASALNAGVLPALVSLINRWYPGASGVGSGAIFIFLYGAYAVTPAVMALTASGLGMPAILAVPAIGTVLAGLAALGLPRKD